jgi:hypothetical protein
MLYQQNATYRRFFNLYGHLTVYQSSGLKDKNGTEIFDQDILSSQLGTNTVYIHRGTMGIMLEDNFIPLSSIDPSIFINSLVIGNTLQNPNLNQPTFYQPRPF